MSANVRTLFPPYRFKIVRNSFERKAVSKLPTSYQKFYAEWMNSEEKETPVHWVPRKERWERNPETGQVNVIQNEPIPVMYPNEMHSGIWGGEGVVEGLIKKGKYRSPVPKFWVPELKKTVVYSEILDKYLSITVTQRALSLIDQHYGLDSYLLKTPAYDLKSLLALKLKRKILLTLIDKDFCVDNPKKQADILEKYKDFVVPREDAEWYGLSIEEAKAKFEALVKEQNRPAPLKQQLRLNLIEELKIVKSAPPSDEEKTSSETKSWTTRLNPFSKPKAAP